MKPRVQMVTGEGLLRAVTFYFVIDSEKGLGDSNPQIPLPLSHCLCLSVCVFFSVCIVWFSFSVSLSLYLSVPSPKSAKESLESFTCRASNTVLEKT